METWRRAIRKESKEQAEQGKSDSEDARQAKCKAQDTAGAGNGTLTGKGIGGLALYVQLDLGSFLSGHI